MICFAAIMPHPPILVPNVGKENLKKLKKTSKALDLLGESFKQAKPDLVLVISPHGDIYPDAFTINTLPEYEVNFEEFGDFETRFKLPGNLSFVNRFKEQVETTLSVHLKSVSVLDHGCSVPLYFLTRSYKDFSVVPITYSFLSYEQHVKFGEELREAIETSQLRVAIIASGDLSHRLSLKAPGGFSPRAKDFDKKIVQVLKTQKLENLLNLDPALIEDAGECGLRSIFVLNGIIKDLKADFQVMSYESPFGVGYLVGEYVIN